MKTIHLAAEQPNLDTIINLARTEPVLLLTGDGKEFLVAEADDFEEEVETLRRSSAFQQFLEGRSACSNRVPLAEIEAEIERELNDRDSANGPGAVNQGSEINPD
jgi:hypothetical protein